MSDSTMKSKEPPKTCGTCRYPAHLVECFARFGTRRTNSKACECYEPAPSEQRYQQLEQVGRELLDVIEQIRQPVDPVLDVIVERAREALGGEPG